MHLITRELSVMFTILHFEDGSCDRTTTFYNKHGCLYEFKTDNTYYQLVRMCEDLLEEMCYIENNVCKSEIMNFLRDHDDYFVFRLDLDYVKIIVTYDRDSGDLNNFKIFNDKNHNNIGFDHLYDDSEYPNDF